MNADLDRMMAIQVMGWEPSVSPLSPKGTTTPNQWDTGKGAWKAINMRNWHPRTDIAQAFMCLEELGTGWFIRGSKGKVFCCVLGGDAEADTPAEAICLAIKKALEERNGTT